ncbi:MAG: ABC transporter substrate-binding protein [Dehalococcoidia bacterium]|nr:ABC transporter substrate-binding protein [Dehalococcoidia bacterium]
MRHVTRLWAALIIALAIGGVAIVVATSTGGLSWFDNADGELATNQDGAPGQLAPDVAGGSDLESVPSGEPGVFDDYILFGQSAAFSGPANELGINMRLGIKAAFQEVNQRGGVNGRQLELKFMDDAYEPEAAITNTKQLIEDGIFALIGAVGTPTSRSATPVAAEEGIPYVAPFTGAAFLRDPEWQNIVNLRASYNQETEEMVERLTEDLGIERIAVMYQDDSYGRAGYSGATSALARRGMEPVSVGLYPRNTLAVKTGLLDLRKGNPEAVIIIGAYQPVAALISWARFIGMDPIFMTVSFVGSNALAEELVSMELRSAGTGVFVTQVVPFPRDTSLPIVQSYHRALSDFAPAAEPGFVSFEGYLAGRLAIAALERCGRDVTRTCFLDIIRNEEPFELDGFEMRYGLDDNQGSDAVFLTVIGRDGTYHPISTLLESER